MWLFSKNNHGNLSEVVSLSHTYTQKITVIMKGDEEGRRRKGMQPRPIIPSSHYYLVTRPREIRLVVSVRFIGDRCPLYKLIIVISVNWPPTGS